MNRIRITGGVLLTDTGESASDLLLSDGKIEAIIPRDTAVSGDYRVTDATGLYVSPGFIDIHQHGGGGADYMDNDPDAYRKITEAHLRHGTTAVMPTLLSADTASLFRAIDAYKAAMLDPRVRVSLLGLHIEGPYISPMQAGAQKREHIRAFDPAEYRSIHAHAAGCIKRWSVAPEVEGAEAFARFASENGITLSIAHSNADLDTVRSAFDMGFRHVTHLYSCTSTITRRGGFRVPGVLEAAFLLDGMNVELIADGCHLPHSLLALVAKCKSPERIALITDAMRAAGEESAHSFLGSMDDPLPVVIEDGVAKMLDRTAFAGSIATADRLVRNMWDSGTPLADAVRMVTAYPIDMMHLDVKKGRLRSGYDADLCFFDRDITVHRVFLHGEEAR